MYKQADSKVFEVMAKANAAIAKFAFDTDLTLISYSVSHDEVIIVGATDDWQHTYTFRGVHHLCAGVFCSKESKLLGE